MPGSTPPSLLGLARHPPIKFLLRAFVDLIPDYSHDRVFRERRALISVDTLWLTCRVESPVSQHDL